MARTGSETRKKNKHLIARCSEEDLYLANYLAEKAGLSLSAYIHREVLKTENSKGIEPPPLRSQKDTAQIIGLLGQFIQAMRDHCQKGSIPADDPTLHAIMRDIADLKTLCFETLGRKQ